jgi:hypothetical protein
VISSPTGERVRVFDEDARLAVLDDGAVDPHAVAAQVDPETKTLKPVFSLYRLSRVETKPGAFKRCVGLLDSTCTQPHHVVRHHRQARRHGLDQVIRENLGARGEEKYIPGGVCQRQPVAARVAQDLHLGEVLELPPRRVALTPGCQILVIWLSSIDVSTHVLASVRSSLPRVRGRLER